MSYRRSFEFSALVLLFVYWTIVILRLSFTIAGDRYFALLDDQMISMRYARHIADGFGAVWNVGEPSVEGFTNPIWTLVMALVHLAHVPPSHTSLVIELVSAVTLSATLLTCLRLLHAIVGAPPHPIACWPRGSVS